MPTKRLEKTEVDAFKNLVTIFKEVFENDEPIATEERLAQLLANPDFMVFVVEVDRNVVGGLTVYVLHRYYNSEPVAYIYDVGISPKFQGQGLGKALMQSTCDYLAEHGFVNAYVEAESEDIEAVNFYRKTAISYEMNAIHFTYELNG